MLFFTDLFRDKRGCGSGGFYVCISAGRQVGKWSI
ncbi:Uncharacterised protein [Staphylococcus caeli]|uniref:Uncharacterized protein n=1 Tax=Staphylococcus caeli TaxID=2201815 RepID=A0A1D4NQY6_9STAP|nr:hypothetical protein SCC82B_00100 [Staphylococcus caeli]SCT09915.1 Uncharacterised protein [Staphylococcus caeli]SCT13093.1 Uncharacterised protein [Staphylococcus caeli]